MQSKLAPVITGDFLANRLTPWPECLMASAILAPLTDQSNLRRPSHRGVMDFARRGLYGLVNSLQARKKEGTVAYNDGGRGLEGRGRLIIPCGRNGRRKPEKRWNRPLFVAHLLHRA